MRGALSRIVCAAAVAAAMSGSAIAVISAPLLVSPGALAPAGGSAISADGRFVVFTSTEALTEVPTGGVRQLYVRDLVRATTTLASRSAGGAAADADVHDPVDGVGYAISGDGRYVVFSSEAENLGEVDGGDRDVFRADLVTGAIGVVSVAPGGASANGPVLGDPDITFDGRLIAFETGAASNLWSGDTGSTSDIVLADMANGQSTLVTIAAGTPLSGVLRRAAISADGRTVVFEDDGAIVMRQVLAATTTAVSLQGAHPDVSGNGRFVAFERPAGASVIRRDHLTGTETVVAATARRPQISADGQRVVVESEQGLIGSDGNAVADVYSRRIGGAFERVSIRLDGTDVDRAATRPAVAGNGGRIAFGLDDGAPSESLVPGDTDGDADVLVAALAPTDLAGPVVSVGTPSDGGAVGEAEVVVSGAAVDVSGVATVTVNGYPAELDALGGFRMTIPLPVGATTLAVRAVDGAGNVGERFVAVVRAPAALAVVAPRVAAQRLRVVRVGARTEARFLLPAGALRVTARLWRRVPRVGQPPTWAPVGRVKSAGTAPGARRVVLSPGALRPDIYQVRVTCVSAGGVAVATVRHRVFAGR